MNAVLARVSREGFGLRSVLSWAVRAYRFAISPVLPRACRFEPSCSAYAEEALRKHPFLSAAGLITRRIVKCHPFHPGGYDPVP